MKISDEDKVFLLLSSFSKSSEGFVDTMLYGMTTLNLEDVKASLSSKDFHKNNRHKVNDGDGLIARTLKKRDQKNKSRKEQGKNQENVDKKNKKRKYFYARK